VEKIDNLKSRHPKSSVISLVLLLLWKLLLSLGGVLAIAYIAACIFLLLRQNRFIFKPHKTIRTIPTSFNLDYQEVWLPVSTNSGNKNQVNGWWIPAAKSDAKVCLYLHGNGSNIGDEIKRAFWYHKWGFSTLLIDYRGYGRSPGKFPTEASVYEDVEAVWNYLTQVKKIPPQKIFIYGHSLGGAIAIEVAIRHPEVAGLAVEGTFTNMREMVAHLYKEFLIFPVDLLLHQKFDSLSKVRSLKMPVLFIHGTTDSIVPAHMSQTLFAAAPEPKKLLLVPQAGHHDVEELGGEQYFHAVQWLIEQAQTRIAQLTKP
jgi:pimeloyl-ACP methyl ester carboxylesterase